MTQEIKDVVILGVSVAELVDAVTDGVSIADILSIVGVLKKVKPAIAAVKSGVLLDEYKNLNQVEKDELVSWFELELDLKDDAVELAIEAAWKLVLNLNELVLIIKPNPVAVP